MKGDGLFDTNILIDDLRGHDKARESIDGYATPKIVERAIEIRRQSRVKLADAIIFATARVYRRTLVTRNTRDFAPGTPGVHVPYTL